MANFGDIWRNLATFGGFDKLWPDWARYGATRQEANSFSKSWWGFCGRSSNSAGFGRICQYLAKCVMMRQDSSKSDKIWRILARHGQIWLGAGNKWQGLIIIYWQKTGGCEEAGEVSTTYMTGFVMIWRGLAKYGCVGGVLTRVGKICQRLQDSAIFSTSCHDLGTLKYTNRPSSARKSPLAIF